MNGEAVQPAQLPMPPSRYGTAMLRRFGWFYRFMGFGRLLGRVRLEDHGVEQVRAAAERGPVVYVLPYRSTVDHLALNTVLARRRLPLSVWAHGATSFFWQPVADAWGDVLRRLRSLLSEGPAPDPVTSGWVSDVVAKGHPVTVFIQDRPFAWQRLLRRDDGDALAALVEAQARCARPIQLVPVVVVWNRSPEVKGGQVRSFLVGSQAAPDLPMQLTNVYLRSREAFCQIGTPVDLRRLCERVAEERRVRALRILLRRYLHRESKLVRGPRLLRHGVMKKMVLDNPPMRALAAREADALGLPVARMRERMSRDYEAIAARFKWWMIRVAHVVLRPLWTRVFSGVDVTDRDLERIRAAMRGGTAVLVPCHKSHFDYVLLSWVFFHHDLIVPHVIAGMNLAIWPLSFFLRGVGGFFIQRSFAGERIFPAVFSRYLRELIRQGYPVEFFIEGGRTRSGKLMRPRLGVLGMVLEAAEHRPRDLEVTVLPIALAYEQVAEEGLYAAELEGASKRPETLGQLVRARSVLRRRFGRVYLRVGEPLRLSEVVDAGADRPVFSARDTDMRREQLRTVGERVVHRIGAVMVVLPTSLVASALLAHHRRGIRHAQLLARIHRFHALLRSRGAPDAASLARPDQAIAEALDRFTRDKRLEALDDDGERVWAIVPEHRLTLDFYRNQVLHYLAPAAMAAAAVRTLPEGPFRSEAARAAFLFLVWHLRREFVLDPDRGASALLEEGLDALVAHGALARRASGELEVINTLRMGEVYGLLRSLLEGYRLVLDAAARLAGGDIDAKGLVATIQRDGDALLASGGATCPESLSAVTLRNAAESFVESGVFRQQEGTLSTDPELRMHCLERFTAMVS